MCAADQVWIIELTLIHKNIRSVRNSHAQELTLILKIIGQCDVKHILTSQIKTIMPILKISTYIITSITARPVRLASILAIMSVSTFKADVILYFPNPQILLNHLYINFYRKWSFTPSVWLTPDRPINSHQTKVVHLLFYLFIILIKKSVMWNIGIAWRSSSVIYKKFYYWHLF